MPTAVQYGRAGAKMLTSWGGALPRYPTRADTASDGTNAATIARTPRWPSMLFKRQAVTEAPLDVWLPGNMKGTSDTTAKRRVPMPPTEGPSTPSDNNDKTLQ